MSRSTLLGGGGEQTSGFEEISKSLRRQTWPMLSNRASLN